MAAPLMSLGPCKLVIRYAAAAAKLLQSCPTLWDPIDGSPSGSPVPGILQARVLEWGAIAFSDKIVQVTSIPKEKTKPKHN